MPGASHRVHSKCWEKWFNPEFYMQKKSTVHKQKWNESSCRFKTANLPVINTKIPSKNILEEKDLARKI